MNELKDFLIPYLVSQAFSLILLGLAWKKPVAARYIFAVLFLGAGLFNWYTSMTTPEAYLMYTKTAIPLYKDLLNGWVGRNLQVIVPAIATCQLLIGAGMFTGGRGLAWGCLGIILFLTGIAPLGVGSAFPFSITVSVAAFLVYRHWQLRWGATREEFDMPLPGDELVLKADFKATRAITIRNVPDNIFRWIVQIGSKRAGWYSHDRIDNGGTPSSRTLLPEWQQIEKGQFIPFTPDQKNGMWVRDFEPGRFILWEDKKGKASWLWWLQPLSPTETRLITRLRTRYDWKSFWIIYYLIYDIGDIVMMSACMKGIKERAETRA